MEVEVPVSDRFACVTGATGGVGREVCRRLRRLGIRPLVMGRRAGEVDQVAQETAGVPLCADLVDASALNAALESLGELAASVESLFLVASPPPLIRPCGQMTSGELDRFLQVNVVANHRLLHHWMEHSFRRGRRGRIAAMLSEVIEASGGDPSPLFGAYAVSKAALKALLKQYAADYPWLRVRWLSTGLIDTPMLSSIDPRLVRAMELKTPRMSPEDAAVALVASVYPDECSSAR